SQVRKSSQATMHGPALTAEETHDLVAFLKTLPPPPPVPSMERDALRRGQEVFQRQKCATCHVPPLYTSAKTYDVGLKDEAGQVLFNPPSLRGVGQGGPYFHDNRADSLEDVFMQHHHQIREGLKSGELADLVAFLRSL